MIFLLFLYKDYYKGTNKSDSFFEIFKLLLNRFRLSMNTCFNNDNFEVIKIISFLFGPIIYDNSYSPLLIFKYIVAYDIVANNYTDSGKLDPLKCSNPLKKSIALLVSYDKYKNDFFESFNCIIAANILNENKLTKISFTIDNCDSYISRFTMLVDIERQKKEIEDLKKEIHNLNWNPDHKPKWIQAKESYYKLMNSNN